ncbi:MAG: universal stress protein [Candidatus Lambdaproteobacteria bacterium]|nr:universal stress protein [Candidatus Lambdaproteobacteria bacterium]
MVKSLLAALDGSPAATAGLRAAVYWAKTLDAELHAVFIEDEARLMYYPAVSTLEGGIAVPVPLPEEDQGKVVAKMNQEAEAIRGAVEAAAKAARIRYTWSAQRGKLNEVLTHEASLVDMVVMGRRGINELGDSTRPGPTTEALIHGSLRPVLVVPKGEQPSGPILLAYDGGKGVGRMLPTAAYLAAKARSGVSVITVENDRARGEAMQQDIVHYLAPHGIKPTCSVTSGNSTERIVEAAVQQRASMIVMGAYGHSLIREFLFGSTTVNVLAKAPCPVLLMA